MVFSFLKLIFIFFACIAAKGKKQAPQNVLAPTSMPTAAFLASCKQYQDTEASVEAIFENGNTIQRAFVTDLVRVVSESPDVAFIEGGNKIVGTSLGSSVISVNLPAADIPINTDIVTVSSDPVKLVDLQVTAITDAVSSVELNAVNMYQGQDVEFEISQLLQFDGRSAGISVFANFSDGTYADVTAKSNVRSLSPQLTTSIDAYGPLITVGEYALAENGHLIEASFPICIRNDSVTNTGYVDIDIEPLEVIFTPLYPTMCNIHDLASFYPFSLPAQTYFFVSILFKGGYVRNFTDGFGPGLNPRAVIHLNNGTDRVELLTQNYMKLTEYAKNATLSFTVTFPNLYNISGTTYIHVVEYQGTTVTATTFPANPGIIKNTIYELDCSGKQQHLQLLALGTLSNGQIKDVTFNAQFTISDPNSDIGRMYRVKNFTLFEAGVPGTLYVSAQFGTFVSYWGPLHVLPRGVTTVVSGVHSYGHAPNDTMRGHAGSQWNFVKVKVFFDDGTYYPEVVKGMTNQWINASELVFFNTSNPQAVQISQDGNATLIGNYYAKVFIEVSRLPSCSGNKFPYPVMDDVFVYTNLMPVTYDFDMGSTVGPKYGTVLVDAPFHVPIGVQSKPDVPITTFHMIMTFDHTIISVDDDTSGCWMDPSWTGFFECTTNNPPGQVHIAGICGMQGCVSEDFVKFAHINFRTNGIGKSTISGEIVRTGDTTGTTSNNTIVAGTDDVLLQTATPTSQPTAEPSGQPTGKPSSIPSMYPTSRPTGFPTPAPTPTPTLVPTPRPSAVPTIQPTAVPTVRPTYTVTARPTFMPTAVPTVTPTAVPTRKPSKQPTAQPTREPSMEPTRKPTKMPTPMPTRDPTSSRPTKAPTIRPTMEPTREPTTGRPSRTPTAHPTEHPTEKPSFSPTEHPTERPTLEPTEVPTVLPTIEPTPVPSVMPTRKPTRVPTVMPTEVPTARPTAKPTPMPTTPKPSAVPTFEPTTRKPTAKPTKMPTAVPSTHTPTTATPTTAYPTSTPTAVPTSIPTAPPTGIPTSRPTILPTSTPTSIPTFYPTAAPTPKPTRKPSAVPTKTPHAAPTYIPTRFTSPKPTVPDPTYKPTAVPSTQWPTSTPSSAPTVVPTVIPTVIPTSKPSPSPTSTPTCIPTCIPSSKPSTPPTSQPTGQPTSVPTTSRPTSFPTTMPTVFITRGYNFSHVCDAPAVGTISVTMRGTQEVCSDMPAYGNIPRILSDLKISTNDANYTVKYSVSISNPLGTQSVRFGAFNDPAQDYYPALSNSTIRAPFKFWDIAYDFGTSGETLKGTLTGADIISGIGLFRVCLVNLDPLRTHTEVNYTGSVSFHDTMYDCGIPLSGYVSSVNPTSAPSSRPSLAPPTSIPTSAPSFSPQKDGINFLSLCDETVYGEVVLRDLPYMREGCGYFAGRGVESIVEVELYYQEIFSGDNPVQVIVQDLTNNIAYRYGDSFVNISTATGVSQLSKDAQFIPFADGINVGYMMRRKIVMPMNGFNPISGTGWFSVCLINTGYNTNAAPGVVKEFVVTGGINFLDFAIDCFTMFTQPLIAPQRRGMLALSSGDDAYAATDTDAIFDADAGSGLETVDALSYPKAVNLLTSSARQRHVLDIKGKIEKGDTTPLIAFLQTTANMFLHSDDNSKNSIKSIGYVTAGSSPPTQYQLSQISQQQSLRDKEVISSSLEVLQQLGEEGTDYLYAHPVTTTFEAAPRTQVFAVPAGTTTITVAACGGSGGRTLHSDGGLGGCIKTIIPVAPKQTLYITVGGEGQSHGVSGFHGGGIGSSATLGFASASNNAGGAGGGGASEIRFNDSDIWSRIVVAGGGGGGGSIDGAHGGPGGGLVGGGGGVAKAGTHGENIYPSQGGGQTQGGAGGKHKDSSCETNDGYLGNGGASSLGGGGGGGYFGGGGGCYSGGAGGSNYAIGSVAGNLQGVHSGPGFVRLTYNERRLVRDLQLVSPSQLELPLDHEHARLLTMNSSSIANSTSTTANSTSSVNATVECFDCVMGDVNKDCVFDAQDARELQQIVVKNKLSNASYHYTSCQRIQMDPNRDGYVNVLDILYLLRVATKKYRFLQNIHVQYNVEIGLMVEVDVRDPHGEMFDPQHASVSLSIATHQGPDFKFVSGVLEPDIQYPWGVQVTPAYMPDTGLVRMQSSWLYNENGMAIAVIVRTYDDWGRTSSAREYTFFCTPYNNPNSMCLSSFIRPDFDGYFEFDVTGMPTWAPTFQPTWSFTPTSAPTSSPSVHVMLVQQTISLIHPVITTSSGAALPTRYYPTITRNSTWSRPFNVLMGSEPEDVTTFVMTLGERQYNASNSATVITARRPAASIEMIIRTPVVYASDRTVAVAYQVRDSRGDTAVDLSSQVELLLNADQGSLIIDCSSPDTVTGIGWCNAIVNVNWWNSNNRTVDVLVRVKGNSTAVVEATGSLSLFAVSFALPSSGPYMLLTVATKPVSPGEQFTSTIICDTGKNDLISWTVSVEYNSDVVKYVSYASGSGYKPAYAIKSENNTLRLSSSAWSRQHDIIKGNNVLLVEIVWEVSLDASEGIFDVMKAEIVSSRDVKLEADTYMFVQDHRDYNNYLDAQLHVLSMHTKPVGVFAYASHSELMNTASLNNEPVLSMITVMGLAVGTDSVATDITSSCLCAARNDSVAVLNVTNALNTPCVVALNPSATAGSSHAMVDVTCAQGTTSVPFRIWYAQSVKISTTDNVLNIIYPAHILS